MMMMMDQDVPVEEEDDNDSLAAPLAPGASAPWALSPMASANNAASPSLSSSISSSHHSNSNNNNHTSQRLRSRRSAAAAHLEAAAAAASVHLVAMETEESPSDYALYTSASTASAAVSSGGDSLHHASSAAAAAGLPSSISPPASHNSHDNHQNMVLSTSSFGSSKEEGEEEDDSSSTSSSSSLEAELSQANDDDEDSMRMIYRNAAFDGGEDGTGAVSPLSVASNSSPIPAASPLSSKSRRVSTASATEQQQQLMQPSSHSQASKARRTRTTSTASTSASTASSSSPASPVPPPPPPPTATNSPGLISLQFGPNTTVDDLKYFAERGCIVALLEALVTPRLVALGTRMLADYAKQANRRVAVASNRRILDFLSKTMLLQQKRQQQHQPSRSVSLEELPSLSPTGTTDPLYQQQEPSMEEQDPDVSENDDEEEEDEDPNWMVAREYAVETIRSLTATEESDVFLMKAPGLLPTLALVSVGGPFTRSGRQARQSSIQSTLSMDQEDSSSLQPSSSFSSTAAVTPMASEKAQLHACIAIMNLSCGKANKTMIAQVSQVLTAMRDVMLGSNDEARLKATTCIKNLSNADANDAALLQTPGLVQALAHVASYTCCQSGTGATPCTTNACLALMNLSIAKANKNRVFCTPGVMESLMKVLEWTTTTALETTGPMSSSNKDARIKACSALSNLAIGYDNKIPMFHFPGFVSAILNVIQTDNGEARTKACSILWSFAAEMKNQIPVVQRGDILPVLVQVAQEDETTEARFKCVAALTLLAESLENAVPLLEAGALVPLMDILHSAGADPTRWKGQTASWCVGFLMNIAQSDDAVPSLRQAGVVELLAPLLTLDHYQSLKAAMAVTFCCRFDKSDECYDLLRKTENVIPKIINLLHNTLNGRGGNGYKYGVFTLRSSVGCISALASGPDFMKERIATSLVFESLLKVLTDFCVDGGTKGAIVGGGREDAPSATLALKAIAALTAHLIPTTPSPTSSCCSLPFGSAMEDCLIVALESFYRCQHPGISDSIRQMALDSQLKIEAGKRSRPVLVSSRLQQHESAMSTTSGDTAADLAASMATNCCGLDYDMVPGIGENLLHGLILPSLAESSSNEVTPKSKALAWKAANLASDANSNDATAGGAVRTFLLADSRSGLRFVVPSDPSGGRVFNDTRMWCYRRGRYCKAGEEPDPKYVWTFELQQAYEEALSCNAAEDLSSGGTSIQVDATVSPSSSAGIHY